MLKGVCGVPIHSTSLIIIHFRAREIQEESLAGRYRPPALRGISVGGPRVPDTIQSAVIGPVIDDLASPLAPPSHPPGFRRARAGTLPSNVQLAAQHYASTSDLDNNTNSPLDTLVPQAPSRPNLRHSASLASNVSSNSRLRSGSLTLPAGGLSNAFGPSIFSSSWLSNANSLNALDELRSIASLDSQIDEYDVHTLDYLGLDDAPYRSPPATVSELRNQAQAAIAGSLLNQPSRLRATTVSNPYRRLNMSSILNTPSVEIDEAEEKDSSVDDHLAGPLGESYDGLSPNGLYSSSFIARGFKQGLHLEGSAARPRAISVGNLEDSTRLAGSRRATLTDAPPGLARKPSFNDLPQPSPTSTPQSGMSQPAPKTIPASILRKVSTEHLKSPGGMLPSPRLNSPVVRFPNVDMAVPRISTNYLNTPIKDNRSVSPSREHTQGQIPSRSLWIGNLDPSMTGEALAHVFAPYGAIESFRLLPEKVRSLSTSQYRPPTDAFHL